jgi:hypothetical protein
MTRWNFLSTSIETSTLSAKRTLDAHCRAIEPDLDGNGATGFFASDFTLAEIVTKVPTGDIGRAGTVCLGPRPSLPISTPPSCSALEDALLVVVLP